MDKLLLFGLIVGAHISLPNAQLPWFLWSSK